MCPAHTPNRLIREKSPYLLQHARNPVDWYPWGEEAFERARAEDKPIFLSIGYSTCHWCHVMERESFENESIAAIMNEHFICIKVDREERPDVDRVYMTALQAMGQSGGWPMSMFLTPDRKPFYGGTYFPPDSRYGRAGFAEVLKKISRIWRDERPNVDESARGITTFLDDVAQAGGPGELLGADTLNACFREFASTYDAVSGGFGRGPKFPRPSVFNFLLRHHARTSDGAALSMVVHTLSAMAAGGLYDQIGGGFHRYSVDGEWRVPHFEKMLYDQAQLVQAYLDAYLCTRDGSFGLAARETLDYVLRDMTDPRGGFYSAEDADSPRPGNPEESGEGAFYVWTKEEIDSALQGDAPLFNEHFGVVDGGNAPLDPQHEFTGLNILYRHIPLAQIARRFGLSEKEVSSRLETARKILFTVRSGRPRPLRDDKVLTAWNGLMIGAFARGSRVLGDPRHLQAALRAAEFVTDLLWDGEKKVLLRRHRDGESGIEAHLDDYVFFVSGLLDLYEASGDGRWLEQAVTLTERQVALFLDNRRTGFFDTDGRDGTVLVRMKEQYDGAEPAGNSVAALNLVRLSRLIDRPEWEAMGRETIASFSWTLRRQPSALPMMAAVLDFSIAPPRQVVIAGSGDDPRYREMINTLFSRYIPTTSVIQLECGERGETVRRLNPYLRTLGPVGGKPAAYICHNFACDLPVTDAASMASSLDGKNRPEE